MSHMRSADASFGLRLLLPCALVLAAAACTRRAPAASSTTAKATATETATSSEPRVVVSVDGKPFDAREADISLNPCKGETPGNVLGVSEQSEAPQRVAAFLGKLRDPDPKTRACAARQLGYLGADAREALPHIIRQMREDEHNGVRANLTDALWAIGPDTKATVDEWLAAIRADDSEVRLYGAFALGYYKPHPARQKEIVGALAAATRDKDDGVRWMAVRGLARLGPSAAEAVPDLLAVVLDEKDPLRSLAAIALGNIGPEAERAAPDLLKAFHTAKEYDFYSACAMALGKLGPSVVPLLAKEMKTNQALRTLDVLSHLRPHGAPLVIEALRAKSKQVRAKALEIIWFFGDAAAPAVPLLAEDLRRGDKETRKDAAVALHALGPLAKSAAPSLLAALGDEDDLVQCYAAKTLGEMGAVGASAVPELQRLMALPDDGSINLAQRCAAEALLQMGPETKALVPPEMIKKVEEYNALREKVAVLGPEEDKTKPKPKEKQATAPPESVW
jgi:HEAT repeat protein